MTTYDRQLDEIYRSLGPRGRFFKLQIFLLWMGTVPAGIQLLSNVFIGYPVPHRCARPSNESDFINSYKDIAGHTNVTVFYDKCEIHIKSNDTTIKKEMCLFGMEYDLPIDSSFVSEFDLVCDSLNLARLTQTLVIAGQACGALLAAVFSDRLGRKPILVVAHIGITITGIAIAYSTNYVMFSILKFIVGGFQQAIVTVTTNIFVELMRVKNRRISASLGGLFWASGVILLDTIAYILKDHSWRTIQLAISLVTISTLVEICLMRESLRWLLANGKTTKAAAYIKTAAKMNGKTQEDLMNILEILTWDRGDDDTPKNGNSQKIDKISEQKSSNKMSYLDLFRHRRLFLQTLILWVAWFTAAFGFFAIYSTNISGNRFLNFFLTALMETPPNVYFYFAFNRHGRKSVVVVMFSTMSVGLIASGIFRSLGNTTVYNRLSIAFNLIAMVGASGGFGILFNYTPELFPTNIRNQALGISSIMARVGGMMAPFTAVLSDKVEWGPGVLIGGLACLVAVLVRFLPETNGRELPQTLDELLAWFKYDNDIINSSNGVGDGDMVKHDKKAQEENNEHEFTVL